MNARRLLIVAALLSVVGGLTLATAPSHRTSRFVERAQQATFTLHVEVALAVAGTDEAWEEWGPALMNELGSKRVQRRFHPAVGPYRVLTVPVGGGTAWWFATDSANAYALTATHVVSVNEGDARRAAEAARRKFPAFDAVIASAVWYCPGFRPQEPWPPACAGAGEVAFLDTDLDVAVLGFRGLAPQTLAGIVTLPLGDSDRVGAGERIFMVGSPYLVGDLVAWGQWLDREAVWVDVPGWRGARPSDMTSAAGYSGAAVVNARTGEVVAIHVGAFVSKHSGRNVGLSVPINQIKIVLALAGFPVGSVRF